MFFYIFYLTLKKFFVCSWKCSLLSTKVLSIELDHLCCKNVQLLRFQVASLIPSGCCVGCHSDCRFGSCFDQYLNVTIKKSNDLTSEDPPP